MRVLLIGEPSNLHWTLAEGLRENGHQVITVSDGNTWKKCNADILIIKEGSSIYYRIKHLCRHLQVFFTLTGYDVVQINNPSFIPFRAGIVNLFYQWLKLMNKKVFLGAFGDDYYWVKKCLEKDGFRYSNFYIYGREWKCEKNDRVISEWIDGSYKNLNIKIAKQCNGIVACLYEYYEAYRTDFESKTSFIPLPVNLSQIEPKTKRFDGVIRFFIGIDKARAEWKGSDVMLRALRRIELDYPNDCIINVAESIPYYEYVDMLRNSDVLLDQLYSFTPAMNSLIAMAQGLIVVGGGEEENYEILNEKTLRPIINVLPFEDDVYSKLEWIIKNKNEVPRLSKESIDYVMKYHNYINVAKEYVEFWSIH